MHTAFDLKKRMFEASCNEAAVDPYELLDWGPQDRLGVIIDRPVGALGAGLLILLAACAFYDVPGKRRRQHPLYPELYLFHVGGPWGVFTNFDFWPDHKEIFVADDPREVLRAVNNRGVTHLVVVDQPVSPVEHFFKEPEAASDRIKKCWAYSPTGAVADADFTLSSADEKILQNYEGVLELDTFLKQVAGGDRGLLRVQSKSEKENVRSYKLSTRRMRVELDKTAPSHVANRSRIDAAREHSFLAETYRGLEVKDALQMLGRADKTVSANKRHTWSIRIPIA